MKKNFLFTVMAFFLGLSAASCSQDEIVSSNGQTGGETVSVAVNIPVNNPVTRAVPNIPDGYKLRCILQLVNSNDNKDIADGRHVMEVPAGSEKVTFTFNAPTDPYKCLFWADYVKSEVADVASAEADNIYNTADLKAIGYTANAGDEMFKGDVADAFYACTLDAVTGNGALTSVNLVRPFTKITFKSTDENYTDYTKIVVTDLPAPTGFNVMTGTTIGYAGKGEYESNKITSAELAIDESGNWFSAYLFTSQNASTLGEGNDIKFKLIDAEGFATDELYFDGSNIPLTPNHEVSADVQPQKDGDTSIDVIFPGEMENPNKLAVGDYILKDGTWSREYSENAVAIVWKVVTDKGAAVGDAAGNYTAENNGSDLTAKEIVGYAFAINGVERSYFAENKEKIEEFNTTFVANDADFDFTNVGDDYFSIANSNTFLSSLQAGSANSALLTKYNEFCTNNEITGDNTSKWYIPSFSQLLNVYTLLLGYESEPANPTIFQAFENASGLVAGSRTAECYHLTTTIPVENKCAMLNTNGGSGTYTFTNNNNRTIDLKGELQAYIRPVLTIFNSIQKTTN